MVGGLVKMKSIFGGSRVFFPLKREAELGNLDLEVFCSAWGRRKRPLFLKAWTRRPETTRMMGTLGRLEGQGRSDV